MNISSSPEEENKNAANYWRQSGAPQSRGEQEAQEGGRRRRWRCREKPMKRRRRKRTSGRGGRTESFTEALQRSAGVCERRKTQRARIPERLLHGGVRGPGGAKPSMLVWSQIIQSRSRTSSTKSASKKHAGGNEGSGKRSVISSGSLFESKMTSLPRQSSISAFNPQTAATQRPTVAMAI